MVNNITTKVNNIEEACCNEFSRINFVIKNLQNEINQHYAIVQRSNFDQQSVSNESEANSTNESETNSRDSSINSSPSSSSGSSNLSGILDITSDIKIRFKQHFDRLVKARNYTFDEMSSIISITDQLWDILALNISEVFINLNFFLHFFQDVW